MWLKMCINGHNVDLGDQVKCPGCHHFSGFFFLKKVHFGHSKVSLIYTEVSLFQGCPLRGVPLYTCLDK